MPNLLIPSDAFSHGQIKSKLWLCEKFSQWLKKYLTKEAPYSLHWYGSWVGVGPFLLLSQNVNFFNEINLYDLNSESLSVSQNLIDFWRCESIKINLFNVDVNSILPVTQNRQIFINTSCEHMAEYLWLENIPKKSYVILQSTDMPHEEHINSPLNTNDFVTKYSKYLNIFDNQYVEFSYPDKKFKRFILFGQKI